MKFTTLLPVLASSVLAAPNPSPHTNPSTDPSTDSPSPLRIPTSRESAILARRILSLTPIGTLSTVFQKTSSGTPPGLAGMPLGLMDYIADCTPSSPGDPTILALDIETHFRNVAAGSNISLALRWTPPYPPSKRIRQTRLWDLMGYLGLAGGDGVGGEEDGGDGYDPLPYSAANLPRFNLLGYIAPIPDSDDRSDPSSVGGKLASCFTAAHPDARYWLPGNKIHESHFVKLVVTHVYWIGGFGDRAYIGWIPVEEWRNVTREEWEGVRLPGEKKGWKEWSAGGDEL